MTCPSPPVAHRLRRVQAAPGRAVRLLVATLLVAGFAGACASPFQGSDAAAAALFAEGDAALDRGDLEQAYLRFAEVPRLHPESPRSAEAFPLAARIYYKLFFRYRYQEVKPEWLAEQPAFLFDWLGARLEEGGGEDDVKALFLGMPWSHYQDYEAYARSHPDLARWGIRAVEDNGIIESVKVEGLAGAQAVAPGGVSAP